MKTIKILFISAFCLVTINSIFSQWQTYYTAGSNITFIDVCLVDQNVIWACGTSGTVVRSINGGVSWSLLNIGNTAYACYAIYSISSNIAWVAVDFYKRLYKTTNGGINWQEQIVITSGIGGLHFFNQNTGIFISYDHVYGIDTSRLYITRNGGTNWYVSPNSPVTSILVEKYLGALDTNFVWITDNNKIYVLRGGLDNAWEVHTIDTLNPYILASYFSDQNTGYVCDGGIGTQGFKLFRTTNSGINWSVYSSDSSTSVISLHFIPNSSLAFVNGGFNIAISTNNGVNWHHKVKYTYALDSMELWYMDAFDSNSVWIPANKGRLLKYNINYIGVLPISTQVPAGFSLSQNFPNPFNPATRISISLPASGDVSLLIYDINGRLTQVILQDKFLQAGVYYAEIDLKGLASGVYFYSMFFNNKTISTKKMVLVK